MNKMNGDDLISGFLMKLWSLHQEIIFRWGTYTMFHYQPGLPTAHKEHSLPGYINWFVPKDDANCFEIVQFLEHELDHEREEGSWLGDTYFPPKEVNVNVLEYSGAIQPYIEYDTIKKMAADLVPRLMNHLKEMKDEREKKE